MKPKFLTALFLTCIQISIAHAQETAITGKAYPAKDYGLASSYCNYGPHANCMRAFKTASGNALYQCYADGNEVCSVRLIRVVEIGGSCSRETDYCIADAIAVPYKVESPIYVGNTKNGE